MTETAESSRRLQLPSFAQDRAELESCRSRAKQCACRHCGAVGTLNAHGFLRGYGEAGEPDTLRGRRLFCSNRGRRRGCGRTMSVLLAGHIAGFMVTTLVLARFVMEVLAGVSRQRAWATACAGMMSTASGYRLWRRLSMAQPRLRVALCRHHPPPGCDATEPMAELWGHLGELAGDGDRLAHFQHRLQQPLL